MKGGLELNNMQKGAWVRMILRNRTQGNKYQIKESEVIEIKQLRKEGMTMADINRRTGLSLHHIRGVDRGVYDFILDSRRRNTEATHSPNIRH